MACAALALQGVFLLRVASLAVLDPTSTAFERSARWQHAQQVKPPVWRQTWVPDEAIGSRIKRAVVAAEDSGFFDHGGIEWDAIHNAWLRNWRGPTQSGQPRLVGGSTITQQLAKNLFLSGERHYGRKGQELLITWMLEAVLSKPRILTLYLNHVELGSGVYGVQSASQRYFGRDARALSSRQAAQLAVMLPRPRYFEARMNTRYMARRAAVIQRRMSMIALPTP
jgi:monofunctional biosynthetic peptidoglycan transglycosylase